MAKVVNPRLRNVEVHFDDVVKYPGDLLTSKEAKQYEHRLVHGLPLVVESTKVSDESDED